MPADLIVYALVAAGLVFWLRSVLGTRHGEERERPDPFAGSPEDTPTTQDTPIPDAAMGFTAEDSIRDLAKNPTSTLSVENKTAENGLLDISAADKNFDITFFLEAAQDVFVMGVEAFGEGDKELLADLLADDVYKAFEGAIDEREKTGETLQNEIHAIRKAEVIDAKMSGKQAIITVRFIADETSIVKDKEGQLLSGHPDHTTEMRDIWAFARDTKSRDPRWLVTETRGDFEGDNDSIPNTVE